MDFLKSKRTLNICILILAVMLVLYFLAIVPIKQKSSFGGLFGNGMVPLIGGNVNQYNQITTDQLVSHQY